MKKQDSKLKLNILFSDFDTANFILMVKAFPKLLCVIIVYYFVLLVFNNL